MRSLFLKVFLWFWLAMGLVVAAFLITTELTRPSEMYSRGSMTDRYTSFIAETAALTYEREGPPGLAAYLEHFTSLSGVRARLFDAQGAELSGLGAQPGALVLVRRVENSNGRIFDAPVDKPMFAFPAATWGGRRYVFVGELGAPPEPPFANPRFLLPRFLAGMLTAGLLCYLLARYIVSPVLKLRAVTKQFAGGDLSARVGPLLGRRRDEVAAMGHDFDAMAERVETLVSAQQLLIRDISHELRSPLTRLNVALELARRRAGEDAAPALDRIAREAESINEMIGQLLALSRVESGTDGLRSVKLDLADLVRAVAEDAEFEARGRNRSVRVVACDPCRTTGAIELLRSAVENVVRNAVYYTAEGTEVEIALRCEGVGTKTFATISVRDRGAGVPPDAIDKIFRPFYRVGDARDRQTGGTGLGLAIAARAVHLHGGTIRAADSLGGGLAVEISLPVV
ncbi:MAG TPA: ATP-binding protein [Pyrinomonadaceae bacterium]|jgi:two-component system sensor histidine kinase CpxA